MDIDLDQLTDLMKALREYELDEVELERGDERIVLRRSSHVVAAAPAAVIAQAAPSVGTATPKPAAEATGEFITSPFVGTFYRAPSPDADPFITEGAAFSAGQALCIVEAMKLMNEIEAEYSGVILEVMVENGKPVEYGDRLFRVEKK